MRTKIADLDFSALDAWLGGHPGRCFKIKSLGDELTVVVWHAATVCGVATGPAATFPALLASAIAQCDLNRREVEETRAIREEARRRIAERDSLESASSTERAAHDHDRDGRAAE